MDQNRCLLDVIDNPQLLQSFLESESSAETTNTNNNQEGLAASSRANNTSNNNNNINSTATTTTPITNDSPSLANAISYTEPIILNPSINIVDDPTSSFERTEQAETTRQASKSHLLAPFSIESPTEVISDVINSNLIAIDPVGSVLDSIITETVAEISPSTHDVDEPTTEYNTVAAIGNHDANMQLDPTQTSDYNSGQVSNITSATDAISTNSATETTTQAINANSFLDTNDNNNNSTSSSDTGSNGLLVDEFYSQRVPTNINSDDILRTQQSIQKPLESTIQNVGFDTDMRTPSESTNKDSNFIEIKPETHGEAHTIHHNPSIALEDQFQPQTNLLNQEQDAQQTQHQQPHQQPSDEPDAAKILIDIKPTEVKINAPKPSPTKVNQPNKSNNSSNAAKAPDSKPKRAPRAKKNNKAPTSSSNPSQSPAIVTSQAKPMPTQFMTAPIQQQIMYQSNNGIRQPVMLAHNSMGQPMAGVPQQQRVIQLQTANGPMFFAITPGPAAAINNPMMQQQQQQNQSGMQSHQYPSQQVCFQPNSNIMLNRSQLAQPMKQQQQSPQSQQQQQSQAQNQTGQQQGMSPSPSGNIIVNGPQMLQSPQPRISSPMMAGQTVAISNQQGTQQQVMLPSSQPMMISRMPNQMILNRPQGQLLPGQQQFIQIMTPNGPMLIALNTQQTQQVNNTMVDYSNQVQQSQLGQSLRLPVPQGAQQTQQQQQQHQQQQQQHQQQQQQQSNMQVKSTDTVDGSRMKQANLQSPRNVSNAKSGLDLADLLLDCGILPEDKNPSNQSANSVKPQSPSLSQISSPMPAMPQINSPLTSADSSAHPISQSQPTIPNYSVQPSMQQQPIRIAFGPDGQMIIPTMYGAMRPMMSAIGQQNHINNMVPNNIAPTSIPMMTSNIPNSSAILNPSSSMTATTTNTPTETSTTESPKKTKGKGAAVKRSRPKKSDIDKFPQLKTPKFAQQQQQQQQQMQAVTVVQVPMIVGDQNKVLAAGSDVKPNIAQLASGQQVSLTKFVTPVMQSGPLQSSVSSNVMQTSMIASQITSLGQNQTQVVNSTHLNNQAAIDQGKGIRSSSMPQQQHQMQQQQQQQTTTITTSSTSHLSPSGKVTTNLLQRDNKSGTVESNPHISSSLMPTLSLTVDTLKIEQNGLKAHDGQIQNQSNKGLINNPGGLTTTLVLQPLPGQMHSQNTSNQFNQLQQQQLQQQQQQPQLTPQQKLARQLELRAQSILNQLAADQNAALHPKTKESFRSIEDACKRLLRYHVFDAGTVGDANIRRGKFINYSSKCKRLVMIFY